MSRICNDLSIHIDFTKFFDDIDKDFLKKKKEKSTFILPRSHSITACFFLRAGSSESKTESGRILGLEAWGISESCWVAMPT